MRRLGWRRAAAGLAVAAVIVTAAAAGAPGGRPLAVHLTAATAALGSPGGPSRPVFGQRWAPWGGAHLGTSSVTIGHEGCALTAAAMLLRTYGVATTPGQLNSWLVAHGGFVAQDLLVWGVVASAAKAMGHPITYVGYGSTNLATIDRYLAAGQPVIAQVALDGNMHFVLLTGLGPDGVIWMNDPWTGDTTTFQSRYGNPATGIQSVRLYSGSPVAAPTLSAITAGIGATVSAPSAIFGVAGTGAAVYVDADTVPTASWWSGQAVAAGGWGTARLAFTVPTATVAGSVVVQTAGAWPNYWFPFTVPGQAPVAATAGSPSGGPGTGGTVVTLDGQGLIAPATVTFGGTAARSVTVVSPTQLRALTPPGSGTVQVTVTDWMGSSAGVPFTYAPVATPSATPPPLPTGAYLPVAPFPVLDTAAGLGAPRAPLGPDATATVPVVGRGGVPATGVAGVLLQVGASQPTASGFLQVYPAGATGLSTSTLHFTAGQTVAGTVEVPVGAGGAVSVHNWQGRTQATLRVLGWIEAAPQATAAGLYVPLVPARICDTRRGSGLPCAGATLPAHGSLTLQVTGRGGIPATGVAAAALNLAVVAPASAGALVAYAAGTARPPTPAVVFAARTTTATLNLVRVGTAGQITVWNNSPAPLQLVVDAEGWLTAGTATPPGAAGLHPLVPTRIFNTQTGFGGARRPLGPGQTVTVTVAGRGGVPAMTAAAPPRAAILEVTALRETAPTVLEVYPAEVRRPLASTVNAPAQRAVANLAIVPLSPGGTVCVVNMQGSTQVMIDVLGWVG